MFYFLLIYSLIITGVAALLGWYVYRLISALKGTYIYVLEILEEIKEYQQHLEKVHNMETFYGDNILGALIEHTKQTEQRLQEALSEGYELFGEHIEEEENAEKEEG